MPYLTLTPAYGADYKSGKEVEEAWNAGKDFLIADISHPSDGRYINKEDADRLEPNTTFNIRFKGLANIKQIKPTKKNKITEVKRKQHTGW